MKCTLEIENPHFLTYIGLVIFVGLFNLVIFKFSVNFSKFTQI